MCSKVHLQTALSLSHSLFHLSLSLFPSFPNPFFTLPTSDTF